MLYVLFSIFYINYADSLDKKNLTISGDEVVTPEGVQKRGFQTQYISVKIVDGIIGLANDAFRGCTSLRHIEIPSTVKYAGSFAFGWTKLIDIVFPTGFETIGYCCFYACEYLQSITLPSTLKNVNNAIFRQCKQLKSIYIDSNCQNYRTNEDNSVIISSNNVSVACANIETIIIPEETITIENSMCYVLQNINTIIFAGNKVERIESNAFYGTGLTTITLPSSIIYLGASLFEGTPLASITIPASLTSADDNVFVGSSLTSVIVEAGCKGMKQTQNMVVYNKNNTVMLFVPSSLQELEIPTTVSLIGNTTLQSSQYLTNLTVAKLHPNFFLYNNGLYSSDKKWFLACPGGVTSIEIVSECIQLCQNSFFETSIQTVTFNGNAMETIEMGCFSGCKKLTSIALPTNLKKISTYGFSKSALDGLSIIFPSTFTTLNANTFEYSHIIKADFSACTNDVSISNYAFVGCKLLNDVILPNSISYLNLVSFASTNITSIIITSNVKIISEKAFFDCAHLKNVTFQTSILTLIDQAAFKNTAIEEINLPDSVQSLNSYSFAECTKLRTFTMTTKSQLRKLDTYVFMGCLLLETIYLGKFVNEVRPRALSGTYGLTSIHVSEDNLNYSSDGILLLSKSRSILYSCPGGIEEIKVLESVKEISDSAFFGCIRLRNVSFATSSDGTGITKIGESTFSGCTNLSFILIPECLEELSNNVFEGCTNLTTVTFADNSKLSVLNSGVFTECEKLSEIKFGVGSHLTEIGNNAFKNCFSLSYFEFPPDIKNVGDGSFEGCRSIKSIILPEGIQNIGSNAFSGCLKCESFILPSSLKTIGPGALSNCPIIKSIIYCGYESFAGTDIIGNDEQQVTVKMLYEGIKFGRSSVIKILDEKCNVPTFRFTKVSFEDSSSKIGAYISIVVCSDDIK